MPAMRRPIAASVPMIVIDTRIPPTHRRRPSPTRRHDSSNTSSRPFGTRRRRPLRYDAGAWTRNAPRTITSTIAVTPETSPSSAGTATCPTLPSVSAARSPTFAGVWPRSRSQRSTPRAARGAVSARSATCSTSWGATATVSSVAVPASASSTRMTAIPRGITRDSHPTGKEKTTAISTPTKASSSISRASQASDSAATAASRMSPVRTVTLSSGDARRSKPLPFEQRLDPRRPSVELLEQHPRLLGPRAREDLVAEHLAVGARQPAVLVEPLPAVARQHLAPDVRVIGGRIAAGEDVREIRGMVAGRHGREKDAVLLQREVVERGHARAVLRDLVHRKLVPVLIEHRGHP